VTLIILNMHDCSFRVEDILPLPGKSANIGRRSSQGTAYALAHFGLSVLPPYVPTPHWQSFCLLLAEWAELCQFLTAAWDWQLPQMKNGEETPVAYLMLQQSL
jgi:hypothetical protein